ncbi:MAG: GNAT family N-acetyltransferase [Chloroflexi bacterium]|nr:GNAT family N-acetyltransferase [Chloroflexota bacterium]
MELLPYKNYQDLNDMLDLLDKGCQADNGTYYVHRGDLQWWLFYTDTPQEVWQSNIRLAKEGGQLLGWILLSLDENAFDIYVKPGLRGTSIEHELFSWAVEQMSALDHVDAYWIAEDDSARMDWLKEHGFTPAENYTVLLKRGLSDLTNAPALPAGFSLRTSRRTEEDARLRAMTSHAAFGSEMPFEEYWPRTWRFMQSPVYVPEHEIFVTAPDGRVASYCIIWTDMLNKIGHFEPVGTHPDFQRKGLGKSLLFEGLSRLKSEGMTEATVCTGNQNTVAIHLYESVGFRNVKKLLRFTKESGTS